MNWHKQVPKDQLANVRFRKALLERAASNPALQQGLLEMCRRDLIFFIDAFIWQHNPKRDVARAGPFICHPFQETAALELKAALGFKSKIVEKSRELGASWMVLMIFLHSALFEKNVDFLFLSKTFEDAESDSPQSLFWKIRYMLDRLPDWMKGPIKDRQGFIGIDRTRSTLSARAPTSGAGVSGRYRAIMLDEFQKMDNAEAILDYTSDCTNSRIFIGTHVGVHTLFYKLCADNLIPRIVLHWSMDPEKGAGKYHVDHATHEVKYLDKKYEYADDFRPVINGKPGGPFSGIRSPWYDQQCIERPSERDIAMNLDIDPKGATDKFFDTVKLDNYIRQYARPHVWQGNIIHNEAGQQARLAQDDNGLVKLWLYPRPDGSIPRGKYAFGFDVSQGNGSSPSTGSAINLELGEKVFEYANKHIAPTELAVFMVAACTLFRDEYDSPAKLNWEVNGPGSAIGARLSQMGFSNVYFREGTAFSPKVEKEPGWTSTNKTKENLFNEYRDALFSHFLKNPSIEALKECHEYKFFKNTIEHSRRKGSLDSGSGDNHGDLVIADALAWWMSRWKSKTVKPEAPPPPSIMSARGRMAQALKQNLDSWYPQS
jgi:hypothetical protein